MIQQRIIITVSETAQGDRYYVQLLSMDQVGLNIVIIADDVEIRDSRPPESLPKET